MKWIKIIIAMQVLLLALSCNNQDEDGGERSTLPIANFSANRSEVPPGTVVSFRSISDNASSYNWIFQGGTPSTSMEENPSILFNRLGTYTISLIVRNNEGEDEEVKTNFITVTNDETQQ